MFRNIYIDACVSIDHRVLVAGAVLLMPDGAAIAGRSAAVMWGALSVRELQAVEVVSSTQFGPVKGMAISIADIAPDDVVTHSNVPVTRGVRTAWDLARRLTLREAVPWVDSLARTQNLKIDEVVEYGLAHPGARNVRRAERALSLCDPLAESPPESVLRLELHLAGIAVVAQVNVMFEGQFVARVDLALIEIRLAIEYDGQWHADPGQLGRDRARVRLLNAAGWEIFQVTKEDMRNVPRLIAEIRRKIDQLKRSWGYRR